jgi:hypothetical protein
MTLGNEVSAVLAAIGRDLGKLDSAFSGTSSRAAAGFGLMKASALTFAGVLAGTAGVLASMYKIQEAAREQVHIEEQLVTAGMSRKEIAEYTAKAWELSQTKRDQTSTEFMEMMAEMRNVIPEGKDVMKMAPKAADFMTDIRLGDDKADPKGMLQDALKTINARGRMYHLGTKDLNEEAINDELDWMGRATRFTKGQQNPATFRAMATQGGPMSRITSAEAFYGYGAEVANTLGASKTGTMMTGLAQELIGGTMTKNTFNNLKKYGWFKDKSKVHWEGGNAHIQAGALDDEAGLYGDKDGKGGNPFLWVYNHMKTAAEKMSKDSKGKISYEQATQTIGYQVFGRQNVQRFGGDVMANIGELINSFLKQKEAWGVQDTAKEARDKDPTNIMRQFTSAWDDLMKALGGPMVKPVHKLLLQMADVFRRLGDWANTHQKDVAEYEEIAAKVALVAGAFGLFVAAFAAGAGLLLLATPTTGLIALSLGMAALAYHFPQVLSALQAFNDFLANTVLGTLRAFETVGRTLYDPKTGILTHPLDAAGRGLSAVGSAIKRGVDDFGDSLAHPLAGAPDPTGPHVPMMYEKHSGDYHPSAYIAPAQDKRPVVQTISYTTLDGKVLTKTVSEEQARQASLPPGGSAGYNSRISPTYPVFVG